MWHLEPRRRARPPDARRGSRRRLRAELDGQQATHAELLKAHATLGAEHRQFQQKSHQRIAYLKSQLDEHQTSTASTSSELQRKAARETELEKRLEAELGMRPPARKSRLRGESGPC